MKNHKRLIRIFFSLILFPHRLLSRNIDFSYIFYEKEVSQPDWLDMPWIRSWFRSSCAVTTWKVGESLPFSFLFFFQKCIVCSKYDEFWRTKGVKQGEHPNRTFCTYIKNPKSTQRQSWNMQKWSAFSAKEVRIFRLKCLEAKVQRRCSNLFVKFYRTKE